MNTEYILYLDMDGVLVDFESEFKRISNGLDSTTVYNQYGANAVRSQYLSAGSQFWANLKWIYGGIELWQESSQLFNKVCILSSSGTTDPVKGKPVVEGKLEWLKKNIPTLDPSNVFIVNGKHMKKMYSSKNSILVDDMSTTIQEWNQLGGYGILHMSKYYKKTIETLKDIAHPLNLKEIAKRIVH